MANTNSLLEELQAHLATLQQDPSTPLDAKLLDRCKILLPLSLDRQASDHLISAFVPVLLTLQQDPTPACQLLQRLIQDYQYHDILPLTPSLDLALGLDLTARPYHELALSILEKAAGSISSAAQIALEPRILQALITLLLASEDIGVAEKAREALVKLLRIDLRVDRVDQAAHDNSGVPIASGGQGMVWKRIFGDQDVYRTFFTITSWQSSFLDLGRSQKTTAQIRLLQLVEDITWMDWNAISITHHSEIEINYGSKSLLDYAALKMIPWEDDDPLVLWNLINFLSGIASSGADLPVSSVPPQLEFLVESGLHQSSISLYISNDKPTFSGTSSITNGYLYGPAASYVASYVSIYPTHLLQSRELSPLLSHLHEKLNKTASSWARGDSPSHDLSVLMNLPRTVLLPKPNQPWNHTLLSLLPSSHRNAELLNSLAAVFGGKQHHSTSANAEDNTTLLRLRNLHISSEDTVSYRYAGVEQAASRMVYFFYIQQHAQLWDDVVAHADVIALKDVAIAALGVINGLVNSTWALPTQLMIESRPDLLSEENFLSMINRSGNPPPTTGLEAILQEPTISTVIPYLLSPPKTFSNVSQHRGGAEDNSAYQVAAAKMDTIRALEHQLRKSDLTATNPKLKTLHDSLVKRISEGVMGGGKGIGREIATLES